MQSAWSSNVWLPAGQAVCKPSAVQGGYICSPVVSLQQVHLVSAQLSGAQMENFTFPSVQATAPVASQYVDSG